MNEATLEAKISAVLTKVFPTFKEVNIEHQTSFSLKIGHHNIILNSKPTTKNSIRGISDILFKIANKNVILLELKNEKIKITQDDIDQGLSYARLLHQMPPITLISNGHDNRFFNTYTREEINRETVDLQFIQDNIKNSFDLTQKDFREAINLLLNNDPELFSQIINTISSERFEPLVGRLNDYNCPICVDFNIERSVLQQIISDFKDNTVIGVRGAAFSGKTTLLYQFYNKILPKKDFILFIDCNDQNYSIYKQLAVGFNKKINVPVDDDQIKKWLITSLHNGSEERFYLLLDNFNKNIPETIMAEIQELIDLFKGGNHRILYTIDDYNYKQVVAVPHRTYKKMFDKKNKVLDLMEFDDLEFEQAHKIMFEKFKLHLEQGGYYTTEYREPRILRHLITFSLDQKLEEGKLTQIISVPDYELLKLIVKNKSYPRSIHQLFKKIAACFIEEQPIRKTMPELNTAAFGSGAILTQTFKQKYPEEYPEVVNSSLVVIRELPSSDHKIIYPKIPELVAFHSIESAANLIVEKTKGFQRELSIKYFTDLLYPLPLWDIVGAGVLKRIAQIDIDLFTSIVEGLLSIGPKIESIKEGTKILMHMEDIGHVNLEFASDFDIEESSFIADYFPYSVLSQLAGYTLQVELVNKENKDDSKIYFYNLNLIWQIASSKFIIFRGEVRSFQNMKPFETYNLKGIGHIINSNLGIVEAIVQSIQKSFLQLPEEMTELYNYGFQEKNFNLLYRFYLALRDLIFSTDSDISERALDYVKKFHEFLADFMAQYVSGLSENSDEQKELYEYLINMNIGIDLNKLILGED